MPAATDADTIRILVATDNHVGYNERDPIRGDDSWKTFHEILCLAKERDVDMVLLAGDLFHENKPSRKSMYQVMRSLRMNCLGEKPCELEMLSDAAENFQGAFNFVNYEDPDINIAIPVFSIHGNHDDPSGEGHLAALDLLQMSGLINYYGRTPEADNILVKPVLLQKGRTKLALYGMSNVRDERLYRTFRDGNVRFFQPNTQKDEWFNLMSVHQNHVSHTSTGYLPEDFLPDFLDLVIWGHEHKCEIDPRLNLEKNFHVIQPGSSVATSLMPGEAVAKHVTILSITGKEFTNEPIRLKTVRPFFMKEIVLQEERGMKSISKKQDNRDEIRDFLWKIVDDLIKQARADWLSAQDNNEDVNGDQAVEPPLPLIRLRVDYTPPDGGKFDCENPQRFSNKFQGRVANTSDVVQFHRKKAVGSRATKVSTDVADESTLTREFENIRVEKLVREFLTASSLTIFPQNSFGEAVSDFVDKDDRQAMENFVKESLDDQVKHLLSLNDTEGSLIEPMDEHRTRLEQLWASGNARRRAGNLKPQPEDWDSDLDGPWADQPAAVIRAAAEDNEDDDMLSDSVPANVPARGARGKGRGAAQNGASSSRQTKPAANRANRAKRVGIDDDDEDEDLVMLEAVDDDGTAAEYSVQKRGKPGKSNAAKRSAPPAKKIPAAKTTPTRSSARQTTLNFSQSPTRAGTSHSASKQVQQLSDDHISDDDDDDDAFEPMITTTTRSRTRR